MHPFPLYAKIFATGATVLGLELVASRILTPFFGVSIYVLSSILAVTLVALAIGYKLGGMVTNSLSDLHLRVAFLLGGALSASWLVVAAWSYPFVLKFLSTWDLVGGSIASCLYLMFVPLVALSALNPILIAILGQRSLHSEAEKSNDHGSGTVLFISTLGSVAGVFIATHGILPFLSNYLTFVLFAMINAGLSLALYFASGDMRNRAFVRAAIFSAVMLAASAGTYLSGGLEHRGTVRHNGLEWETVDFRPSYFGAIRVVDLIVPNGPSRRILLNDGLTQNAFLQNGISSTLYTYALERLATAATPDAKTALVLGLGAGVIPAYYAEKGMKVDAVEINPDIIEMAEKHLWLDKGKVNISVQDARTAVRECDTKYDIVAVDLFSGDGVPEHLITLEFFQDVAACMNEGGSLVMNTFMDTAKMDSQHALIKVLTSVFGDVFMAQIPPPAGRTITSGFLMTRKDRPVGGIQLSLDDMPRPLKKKFLSGLKSARVFHADSPELRDADLITDVSNNWKNMVVTTETEHRKAVNKNVPWQIQMN